MKYEKAKVEVVLFSNEDVVTTSCASSKEGQVIYNCDFSNKDHYCHGNNYIKAK